MVFPWSSLVAWLLRIQRCYYYGVGLILAREFPYAAGTAKKNPPNPTNDDSHVGYFLVPHFGLTPL